jgi:hypothetical protein
MHACTVCMYSTYVRTYLPPNFPTNSQVSGSTSWIQLTVVPQRNNIVPVTRLHRRNRRFVRLTELFKWHRLRSARMTSSDKQKNKRAPKGSSTCTIRRVTRKLPGALTFGKWCPVRASPSPKSPAAAIYLSIYLALRTIGQGRWTTPARPGPQRRL